MRLTEGFFIIELTHDIEGVYEVVLLTNPAHPIYQAHFPGSPITPGVCLIQAAGELLENKLGRKLYLQSIKNVKFLLVLVPEEGKKIKYVFSNIVEDENGVKTQVLINDDTTVYAKISLVFSNVRL